MMRHTYILKFIILKYRSEINKVQGEYAQEREYGFAPSFSRTQRIGSQHNDSDSSSLYTLMDDSDVAQSSVYIILPPELNDESVLPAIKHKLDTLHPSQRDYVSTQLLSEVSYSISTSPYQSVYVFLGKFIF